MEYTNRDENRETKWGMNREDYRLVKSFLFAVIGILLLLVLFSSTYIIPAGERGVLLTFGKPDMEPKSEGLHFKMPFIQSVKKMDIKTQKYEAESSSASNDLQIVAAKITVNYRPTVEEIPKIYTTIGIKYEDRVIQPTVQEVVKAATARYTAEQLITKRQELKEDILRGLKDRLQARGIVVEDISITNLDFSESFNRAIEEKVTAEQNALQAKNRLEQTKYEAEQRLVQANAEAEAIKIQAEAIKSNGGKEYVQLQAINSWDGKLPTIYGNGVMPFIDFNTL